MVKVVKKCRYTTCFADELGSVTALYSESANAIVESYTYDAYGRTDVASAYGNPYRFAGRRFDPESKLYYYRARYYNPKLGIFQSHDPLGYIDSMNMYAYCGNNPTNYVDPWGEDVGKFEGTQMLVVQMIKYIRKL